MSIGTPVSISNSGHKFVTPEEVHSGEYINVLKNREIVYEQAKQKFLLVSLLDYAILEMIWLISNKALDSSLAGW
ncbi:hypothetical protein [Bacillus timonensis]|uniref:hypothetical protein n=1 Tax=Bacillus timonensis TaxID=1033734 RepID=UPI0013A5F085|nr:MULTISPECIES: hypothetical protein [Bacillaceae]